MFGKSLVTFLWDQLTKVYGQIVLVLSKIVFVTLCDVVNISNIYEYVNFVFVTLCDVANISNIYIYMNM